MIMYILITFLSSYHYININHHRHHLRHHLQKNYHHHHRHHQRVRVREFFLMFINLMFINIIIWCLLIWCLFIWCLLIWGFEVFQFEVLIIPPIGDCSVFDDFLVHIILICYYSLDFDWFYSSYHFNLLLLFGFWLLF